MDRDGRQEGWALLFRVLLVFLALYLFLVGIGTMSTAFKTMGKTFSEGLLATQAGPIVSLFIGILATTLMQSSSTTTSLVVGLVAAGAIEFHSAVYMVMGANVGTTVTNTIVSLGHITRSAEYKRAFAAATVHDFFNLIVLLVLFPLEVFTGVLDKAAHVCSDAFQGVGGTKLANPIKAITKPLVNELKEFAIAVAPAGSDTAAGWILLFLAFALTFGGLITLVKMLRKIMVTRLENLFDRVLFKSAPRALFFGLVLTILMQSSSITTSVAVPLVGAGVLNIRQVFPYTMGANIGTTMTALLASLAALAGAGPEGRETALLGLALAFHHVLFNALGVALVYPIREVPVRIAEAFAGLALWNRAIPLVYIIGTFYLLPFLVVWLGRPS
ncbi:MAG: Na/Pi symporter [Planctomycetota bacterium JB042]